MEKIKFSIVILNYNTGKEAIECIRSIERTDLSTVEVSILLLIIVQQIILVNC